MRCSLVLVLSAWLAVVLAAPKSPFFKFSRNFSSKKVEENKTETPADTNSPLDKGAGNEEGTRGNGLRSPETRPAAKAVVKSGKPKKSSFNKWFKKPAKKIQTTTTTTTEATTTTTEGRRSRKENRRQRNEERSRGVVGIPSDGRREELSERGRKFGDRIRENLRNLATTQSTVDSVSEDTVLEKNPEISVLGRRIKNKVTTTTLAPFRNRLRNFGERLKNKAKEIIEEANNDKDTPTDFGRRTGRRSGREDGVFGRRNEQPDNSLNTVKKESRRERKQNNDEDVSGGRRGDGKKEGGRRGFDVGNFPRTGGLSEHVSYPFHWTRNIDGVEVEEWARWSALDNQTIYLYTKAVHQKTKPEHFKNVSSVYSLGDTDVKTKYKKANFAVKSGSVCFTAEANLHKETLHEKIKKLDSDDEMVMDWLPTITIKATGKICGDDVHLVDSKVIDFCGDADLYATSLEQYIEEEHRGLDLVTNLFLRLALIYPDATAQRSCTGTKSDRRGKERRTRG